MRWSKTWRFYRFLSSDCGVRPAGELEKLTWASVHLTGKPEVEIPASVSKTRRRRFVDLSENALAWLEAY
jgi:integrase